VLHDRWNKFRETTKSDFQLSRQPNILNSFDITIGDCTIVDLVLYKAQIVTWFQDDNKTAEEIMQLLPLTCTIVQEPGFKLRFEEERFSGGVFRCLGMFMFPFWADV